MNNLIKIVFPLIILIIFFIFFLTLNAKTKYKKATFAGGCFWCMEPPFEKLEGVKEVISGYTGGSKENPTYEEVSHTITGHLEAIQITYNPTRITYEKLLDVFWQNIDPTDAGGQFADRGPQYRTTIYYHDSEQKKIAEKSRSELGKSGKYNNLIVTSIIKVSKFYPAEDYHQDFYKKNPSRYKNYRRNSGRDKYLKEIWYNNKYNIPSKEKLKQILSPLQYKVTQKNGTEKQFKNEYWNNKKPGIYVDVVSGEPLFISIDKFDSGTGWPSFTSVLEPENIVTKTDNNPGMVRTEVRSRHADSHLGHVFNDGPELTGLRYCINSAALRFIPKNELEKKGYEKYLNLFK